MKSTAPQSLVLRLLLVGAGAVVGVLRHAAGPPSWTAGDRQPGPASAPTPVARPRATPPAPSPEPAGSRWLTALRETSERTPRVGLLPPRDHPARRRVTSLAFVAIFALGASLTAVAGDQVAGFTDQSQPAALESTAEASGTEAAAADGAEIDPIYGEDTAAADAPSSETTPTETPAAETPPAQSPAAEAPPATDPAATAGSAAPTSDAPAAPAPASSPTLAGDDIVLARPQGTDAAATAAPAPRAPARAKPSRRTPSPLFAPTRKASPARGLEVETEDPGAATIWLDRTLPDPTPPSRRLTKAFARQLTTTARAHGVDWAVLLGLLRARGELGSVPATRGELTKLARSLSRARDGGSRPLLAVSGDTAVADTAQALAHLHRALGLAALVHGLEWAETRLGERLLANQRISIYPSGRDDIAAGRIDVRVLALIAYLAETYGGATVSSLDSGHRLYSRPGVISAHKYGLAVDIAAVGSTSILGSQQPGGTTEHAVRSILLLPAELRPRQVISLLGLGGPSFPMADHADHIHAGF